MILASPGPATGASAGPRPDPTFGNGQGFVTTPIAGAFALGYDAIASGRDIMLAGQASPPSGNGQVVVARYLPNGQLDGSFASHGLFQSSFPVADAPFIATAIARDPRTGKLIVAGGYGEGSMLVMRLTAGGQLDPTFGTGGSGFATVAVGGIANSVAIQPNGAILLGGSNANVHGRPFVVARFTANGVLDSTFGNGGIVQALFWTPTSAASAGVNSIAVRPGGAIIAAGHIDYIGGGGGGGAGHGAAGVFRLTPRGALSPAFGSGGHTQITFFSQAGVPESWYPCGMTVDGQGRITVTGGGGTHHYALFTARLTRQGTLDRSCGPSASGRAITPGVGGNAITTCGVSSTRAGEITVALQSTLAQLLPDGAPDTSFAPGGVFTIFTPSQVFVNALVGEGSGRILLAGSAGSAIYVARYLAATGRKR
jgi:uncharacterized delta-60 repeat protein